MTFSHQKLNTLHKIVPLSKNHDPPLKTAKFEKLQFY